MKKAISHILDHGCSVLDSPKANQSFPKAAKSLIKDQEEDKVSKKGNKKAKQTPEKLPHFRAEDRSRRKGSSVTPKKSKDVSPSTSLMSPSNNSAVITKTITRAFPLKQKMHLVNGKAHHLQNINKQSKSIKDLEIQVLQMECEELRNRLGCLREGLMGQKLSNTEELLKQSQKELLWLQRQLSLISTGSPTCVLAASKFGNDPSCLWSATSACTSDQVEFIEETQISKSHVTTLNQEYHHWLFSKNELKDAVQEKNRLSLQYANVSHKALQYDQVKSDYDHLRETLIRVTKERDLAVKGKHQLQAKLENLEQVLKHMREAAERRQQLELEHEQALAVLNAKQQEIELLQKAQVEAKKEHEGAVQLLEAKVRELEEKCRTQSEQFNLLSRELEKFRQQAGKIDLLSSNSLTSSDISGSPSKSLSQLMNGIATSLGKGHESPSGSRCVISEFIRPLQISGDKPEQLSVKPTFLSKSRSGTPRCRFDSDMDNDQNSNTSKQRYSGKVHLCIARYSYNPFDGPNENPEAELPLTAGKYLYVYGDMDEDGFYEGELLDGQRGLVPSNFVDFVQDNETRLSSTLSSEQDQNFINHSGSTLEGDILEISPPSHIDSSVISNGAGTLDVNIDEIGEDIVPYPRKITLIKQLAKSVIVGWEPPVVPPGWGTINSYNVLVDKEVRMNIALGSRTKALIEKLNISTCTYRISIQSITNKGNSDELQCTLLVGKDVVVAPSNLKVDNITQISAELSWLPTNSNYSHVIFLNEEEFDIVKAASYKYHFFNLKPNMAYKVKVMAKPHQMPWQLPLEQREKKEAFVEFSTLPAGPPAPPQDVTVRAGSTQATIQVSWKPPALTATGTSHGANVTGYGVYAKGQRVAEVIFPTAENTLVELMRLRSLEAKEVTVRTLSAQGESVDSSVAAIPSDLLVPPSPLPRTAPKSKPLASAGAPETKEEHLGPHVKIDESWEQTRSASPVHGHTLEPPVPNFHSSLQGRRSPSPNRILPQPQGTPVPNTVAKAMAREAAQRVAESNRMERRSVFSERSNAAQYANSDDEEDGYDSPNVKRRGASVDDFLKGSELGKQPHYCHGEDYHTESSRGSDLSDIMEEDEEELYSEMQLEDGGRRRVSLTSHNALKLLGNPSSAGRPERVEHAGRRSSHGSAVPQRSRPMLVPSIDGYGGHDHLSPDMYEESETDPGTEDLSTRIFVALFDYDPLTMSPNPDAAEEELPFKEGQIIKVYGDKDADGFYRGETCTRIGLIPCNMVSEIQADDEEMMDQLLKQGFLPLNTPVEKIERNRRSGRQHSVTTRRMVALYDYDPRESSPNVDVEAELTFCTGDIITVFGEIDEDGFYYGELNGQKGLVPSNFLEEVPDDVEVYLSDAPSRYLHDTPMRAKAKRVPPENTGTSRRAPSPTVHLHSGSPTSPMGSGSPGRGRDMSSKKKKGLLSKGKKLLKKLGAVK
ncbi:RIMS-binding protein 2 isoform X3 [Tympanuchus pallidicinctus]|uniref:RIMS-binding protein 2 isoform X3 n=1 Tax=Tympanuchus pallidicinctus TaxID=109042 RepID=UPI0022874039|nr:RIMS-binding protein 2 isoform X3 [Tympanuchus pallidicinctus]